MVGPLPLRWGRCRAARVAARVAVHNYMREEPTMLVKATSLVGLDVHARQTHVAILRPDSGELAVSRLRMAPGAVVDVLERLGPGGVAGYEAGPTRVRAALAVRP